MRIAVCIEYDGSLFCGWQLQPGQPTVQEELQRAISSVADHDVIVHGAGRTDSGVHACGQIAHFDTESERSAHSWIMGANAKLPKGISVIWTKSVDPLFHARFSAVSRYYRYIILNRASRPTYLRSKVGWLPRKLDESKMREAAACLIGENDFSAFRSAQCSNKVPVKNVTELTVQRQGDWVWIDIKSSGFLHNMVRIIAGTLCAVGIGDQPPAWVEQVLKSRDRTKAGATVAPGGLYFVSASYPGHYGLLPPPIASRYW